MNILRWTHIFVIFSIFLILPKENPIFPNQESVFTQQSKNTILLTQNSQRTISSTGVVREGRMLVKETGSIEPQYENCKGKDIYKLNSEFQDGSDQEKTEASGACIDCEIQARFQFSKFKSFETDYSRTNKGNKKSITTAYQAFKGQLQERVKGQVQAKIAQTQILQKCLKAEENRDWLVERMPKVDWPLMKAVCQKKRKDFESSFKTRWPEMRVQLALSAPSLREDRILSDRATWMDASPSHLISDFVSLPKLSKKEKERVEKIYVETLSKTPLDKFTSSEFENRLYKGEKLHTYMSPEKHLTSKDKSKLKKAETDLRKKARESYLTIMTEMPLLGYSKTGDPQNEKDMGQTFAKYLGNLDELLEKVEGKDVDMSLLLSFEPLVEGLLVDNERYCLAAEGARLTAERNKSLKTWGLVALGVTAAVPCIMGGPIGAAACLGGGLLTGGLSYSVARGEMKDALGRALTGKEFETIASLAEKNKVAFWELMFLPMAAWGTTAGTAQLVKGALKGANSGSFDKLRARLHSNLSTSQVRTAPLRSLSGRSVDEAEKTLKLSKVVSIDPSALWKGGVNNPSLVTLEDGTKAVWKPRQNKLHSNYRAEVLAYELDRKFGFNLVPPTVERTINGKKGSLQLFREGQSPSSSDFFIKPKTSQDRSKQAMFDILIENTDRKGENFLISPEGGVVSIDHGVSFTGRQREFRQQVADSDYYYQYVISRFFKLDESKTIIENMRGSLTVEFEEEIADYLGKEDAARFMMRMRGIINSYDYRNNNQ